MRNFLTSDQKKILAVAGSLWFGLQVMTTHLKAYYNTADLLDLVHQRTNGNVTDPFWVSQEAYQPWHLISGGLYFLAAVVIAWGFYKDKRAVAFITLGIIGLFLVFDASGELYELVA